MWSSRFIFIFNATSWSDGQFCASWISLFFYCWDHKCLIWWTLSKKKKDILGVLYCFSTCKLSRCSKPCHSDLFGLGTILSPPPVPFIQLPCSAACPLQSFQKTLLWSVCLHEVLTLHMKEIDWLVHQLVCRLLYVGKAKELFFDFRRKKEDLMSFIIKQDEVVELYINPWGFFFFCTTN